jgi:coenzyme F420-0:L-glutamate ligase/coenzyme F420-1:gamma-L-glutamate ligase
VPPLEYRVFAVDGIPEVRPSDDLAALIHKALSDQDTPLLSGDVLIVTQKIVSKAEDRVVLLDTVTPRDEATKFAQEWEKDARVVELVLQESKRILRMERGVIISETRHGWICANAGIDASNIGGGDAVALLPLDSSASAQVIRRGLVALGQPDVPVIVTDTFGRPWRDALTNVAIGVSGMDPLHSYVGETDAEGYDLKVTIMALADELAAASEPVMNKLDRVPVAVVRGLNVPLAEHDHSTLIRPAELDMFR